MPDLTREEKLEIYRFLRLNRGAEDRLVNLYRQGKVLGGLYRSLGQEATSVGSAYALEEGDVVGPLIRNLGSVFVMGYTPRDVFAQYMGRASSPSGGKDSNLHFGTPDRGLVSPSSMLGALVAVMSGIALGVRLRKKSTVALTYIGDGGMSTGAFHEGFNFAAVQKLPLVLIAENNGWAYSTPMRKQTLARSLADKAIGYGVPGMSVDGNDVLAVYEATRRSEWSSTATSSWPWPLPFPPPRKRCPTSMRRPAPASNRRWCGGAVERVRHRHRRRRARGREAGDDLRRSDPRGTPGRDAARRARLSPGRRHRRLRRRLQGHGGAARAIWRRPSARLADLRDRDRRRGGRRGDDGDAAGRRDAVRRLHLLRLRHDHQLRSQVALPHGRRRAARHPWPLWRRRPWRSVPLPKPRGVLRPHAGAEDRPARDRVRREGASEGSDPRRGPGHLPRAQVPLPADQGRASARGLRRPDRKGRRAPRGAGPLDPDLWRDGLDRAGSRGDPGARGDRHGSRGPTDAL